MVAVLSCSSCDKPYSIFSLHILSYLMGHQISCPRREFGRGEGGGEWGVVTVFTAPLSPDDQLRTLPTLADLARELPSCPSCLIAAALSVAPETRDQWPGQPSPTPPAKARTARYPGSSRLHGPVSKATPHNQLMNRKPSNKCLFDSDPRHWTVTILVLLGE